MQINYQSGVLTTTCGAPGMMPRAGWTSQINALFAQVAGCNSLDHIHSTGSGADLGGSGPTMVSLSGTTLR